MPQKRTETTLRLAQKLVGHMPQDMDDELKNILLHARDEQDLDAERKVINLLSPHKNIRLWMKEQISLVEEQNGTRLGYGRPPGLPVLVPARWKWSCPVSDCLESYPVIQEGEDAPLCEVHRKLMVRADR